MQVVAVNLKFNPSLQRGILRQSVAQYTEETSPVQMDLAGGETGRALLAATGVGFKGVTEPLDVTEKLNKKIEGQSHLDLPNLKVYDYPVTNLRVFVGFVPETANVDFLPTAVTTVQSIGNVKENLIEEALVQHILARRLSPERKENSSFIATPGVTTYDFSNDENSFEHLGDYYTILSTLNISKVELNSAKNDLKEYFNSEEYKNCCDFVNMYYSEGDFHTKDEILQKLDGITPETISTYYKDFISNSKIETILLVKKSDFDKKGLNIAVKRLDCQFASPSDIDDEQSVEFVLNKEMKVFSKDKYMVNRSFEFMFPTPEITTKDAFIAEFATELIAEALPKDMFIYNSKENIPRNLKNKDKSFDFAYCTLVTNPNGENLDESLKVTRSLLVETLEDENCAIKLQELKQEKKDFYKRILVEQNSPLVTLAACMKYSSNIFSLYEILDSITIDDVKEFVNNYLLTQAPIVAVCD